MLLKAALKQVSFVPACMSRLRPSETMHLVYNQDYVGGSCLLVPCVPQVCAWLAWLPWLLCRPIGYTTECSEHASRSRGCDQDHLFILRLVLRDADRCRPGTRYSVVLCICYSISGNKEFVLLLFCSVQPSYFYTLDCVDIFTLEQRN